MDVIIQPTRLADTETLFTKLTFEKGLCNSIACEILVQLPGWF